MITPLEYHRNLFKSITPAMRYDGKEAFPAWQQRAADKLRELLGLPLLCCEEDGYTIEYTREEDGYIETRFRFMSEPGYEVPCHLLVPKGADKPLPVAICLQGHSSGMHLTLGRLKFPNDRPSENNDFGLALDALREGFCAVAIEPRGFGECGGTSDGRPDCGDTSLTALLLGRTTAGERVWDIQRLIDVLERHVPQADCKHILCVGNSGGGSIAFYAACLEPRISWCIPSCSVCTYEDSIGAMNHCICNYVPGVRQYFDMGDLAGLIAPRPIVVVGGKDDPIFPLHGIKKAFEQVQVLYQAAGCPENCTMLVGEGGHRFYADISWAALRRYTAQPEEAK